MNMPLCSALMRLSNYKTECKIHACWSVSALISFSVLRANKVPAKTGTFLFTFGVWSCRRQRGDSPKPDERAPQRSEATATKYNPKVVWFKSCPRNQHCEPKKISVRKTQKPQRFLGFFVPFFKVPFKRYHFPKMTFGEDLNFLPKQY